MRSTVSRTLALACLVTISSTEGSLLNQPAERLLRTPIENNPLVVKTVDGTVISLSTIDSIEPSGRNSRSAGWFNKEPSVLLIVTKQANANVLDTVDRIYDLLPELRQWVPAGLDISILADRTQTIRASVHDMQLTLGATVILVMLVVAPSVSCM